MPWCPVCKNEYIEGIKVCADCKVDLVDTLEEMKSKPILFGSEEEMIKLNEFLKYNHINSGEIAFDEKEEVYELYVSEPDAKEAKKVAAIFLQEESANTENEIADVEEQITKDTNAGLGTLHGMGAAYENKTDKAENFKTSAYTLVGVGAIGAVVLLLAGLEVLPFRFGILTYVVMGVLFTIFVIMGISSFQSYKRIAKEAVKEKELAEEMKLWSKENLSREKIDLGLFDDSDASVTEEMKYFKRIEKMKELVSETYLNLEDGFLDSLVEELYSDFFEG